MKNPCLPRLTLTATLASLFVCSVASKPARSADEAAPPLQVTASLASAATVALGEPVLLRYGVANTSDQKVGVSWGADDAAWYSLRLTDEQGVSAAPSPPEPTQPATGLRLIRDPFITAGNASMGYLVITKLFRISHPGKYTLTMHVNLPYTPVAATQDSPVSLKNILNAGGQSLSQDLTIPLTVTPTDPAELSRKATQLQQQISAHPYGDLNNALTTALFSMPEAEAAASWHTLTARPGMASGLYAAELKRLGTTTAADLLAGMLFNPALSSDDKAYIGQCLDETYNDGTPTLRRHIAQIAAAHGLSLPEHIPIPGASD